MRAWNEKVRLGDIFHDEELPFEQVRDEIVRRIKRTRWYGDDDTASNDLYYLVEELEDAHDPDEFDQVWDQIYDLADADRVWIATTKDRVR
jgi:hypothetical protein